MLTFQLVQYCIGVFFIYFYHRYGWFQVGSLFIQIHFYKFRYKTVIDYLTHLLVANICLVNFNNTSQVFLILNSCYLNTCFYNKYFQYIDKTKVSGKIEIK